MPDNGTLSVELLAFEVMARLPVALPLEVGENLTLKLTL